MSKPHKQVLIGLGSNLEGPIQQVQNAIASISASEHIKLIECSSLYSSSPQGPQDQDDFVNAVVLVESAMSPIQLLAFLQGIEQEQGRVKTRRWGERCIDLDILFIEQESHQYDQPDLVIPHASALDRDFVIVPCLEVCPDWILPDGVLLKERAQSCLQHNLRIITHSQA